MSDPSRETIAFRQRRVSRFGLWALVVGGFFAMVRIVVAVVFAQPADAFDRGFAYHLCALAVAAAIWLGARGRLLPSRLVQGLDVVGFLLLSICYTAMGMHLPEQAQPHFVVLLALTQAAVLRSVLVPSSALLTGLLTLAVGLVYLPFVHARFVEVAPATAAASTAFMAAWWIASTTVSTITSNVVYGLHREARRARRLGQYTLEKKIGEGGMGTVFRAQHALLRRPTAVKLLHAEIENENTIARFEREVQLTARLTHPNTITIFDYGRTPEGRFYYAMELLEGASLKDVVTVAGPQPPGRVAHILHQVAGALTEAHGINLIHRDIKPANIILTERGGVPDIAKVVDFGLVKQLDTGHPGLTANNSLLGTPLYMAPEAIRAPDDVDGQSDIYALGAVAYFLLTGTDVFEAATIVELCSLHLLSAPERPSSRLDAALPADLEKLILRCLAKNKHERPASAAMLEQELEAIVAAHPWSRENAREWWLEHREALEVLRGERYESLSRALHVTRALSKDSESSAHDTVETIQAA
jgi:eukaryotic-like serine/threonine-protein kinase